MSWQAYVDNNLVSTGKVTKAAILGLKGGVWASSPNFNLSPVEQKAVVDAFNDLDKTRSSGVTLAGTKYLTLISDDRSVYGKKSADGCVLVKTNKAVLVATYVAPIQQPQAVQVTEALADYLISTGF